MIAHPSLLRKFKSNRNLFFLMWLMVLLLSPLVIQSNTANFQRNKNMEVSESPMDLNQITLDQDPLENPTVLQFFKTVPDDNFLTASVISSINRDIAIGFRFDANEGQSIDIEINVTGFLPDSIIFTDIFSGNNIEYIDSFSPNFPGEFPVFFNYQVPISGKQHLIMLLEGPESPVFFGLRVTKFESGEFSQDIITKSQTFQSNAFGKINNIFDYLVNDSEYIGFDGTYSLDLGDFDEDSRSVGKAVATSIFGLLRAGELLASESLSGGDFNPIALNNLFSPFLEISAEILRQARNNLTHQTGGLFYEGETNAPNNYDFTLETNVYMLMAMLEVWNFYQHDDYSTADPFEADLLLAQINRTIIDINSTFYNPTYQGFVENAHINSDVSIASPVHGTRVYLESNALFGEVAFGVLFANGDAGNFNIFLDDLIFNTIITNSTIYMLNNLIVGSDDGNIGVEYFDHSSGLPSNSSTLISNSLLISILTPIGARAFPDIELATEIAETTITKFKSSENGLLYDSVMINSSDTSSVTSTINTLYFLTTLDRLSESWKFVDFIISSASDISRTWNKAVRELQNNFDAILFDEQTDSYFAQYNHETNLFIRDDRELETNNFFANTGILDLLAKTFPVRIFLTAPTNYIVEEDGAIIINIQQINPLRKSWLWFVPERNYTVQAHLTIPNHNVDETEEFDLSTFDFESGFIDVLFTPIVRGDFKAFIELSVEGDTLLQGSIDLVAFGLIYVDWDQSEFETTTDEIEFEPTISIFDEMGRAVSNLEINAFLGNLSLSIDRVETRTDSSGKAKLEFDIENIQFAFSQNIDQHAIEIPVLINVTNAESLKYSSPIFHINMELRKNFLEIKTSPEDPKIVITGKTLMQNIDIDTKLTPVTIQVTTEDSFGTTILADFVSIDWVEETDTNVDISSTATTVPATFTIDPTDLEVGSYEIEIKVQATGFTRGEGFISIFRTLIVESPSIFDSAAAAILVFGGLVAGKILGLVWGVTRSKSRGDISCPNCGQSTLSKQNACQHCGNLLPGKSLSSSIKEKLAPVASKIMGVIPTRGDPSTKEDPSDVSQTDMDEDPAKFD